MFDEPSQQLVTPEQVTGIFRKMASIVDHQNADDPDYIEMAPEYDKSIAFQAALDLVFSGCEQANGYTESVLHQRRREFKQSLAADDRGHTR